MTRTEAIARIRTLQEEGDEVAAVYLEEHPQEDRIAFFRECYSTEAEAQAAEARTSRLQKRWSKGKKPSTRAEQRAQSEFRRATIDTKAQMIAAALSESPDLATRVAQHDDRAYKSLLHAVVTSEEPPPGPVHPETKRTTAAQDIVGEWETWLAQGNAWLMRGARLTEKTETEEWILNGPAAFGPVLYQRITEKKLDAQLRELLEGADLR